MKIFLTFTFLLMAATAVPVIAGTFSDETHADMLNAVHAFLPSDEAAEGTLYLANAE